MKRITFLINILLITLLAKSQTTPINSTIGSPTSAVLAKGVMAVDSAFWRRYSFPDTSTANKGTLKNDPGATIFVAGSEHWIRNQAATKWILYTVGAVDNNQWFGIDAFATFKNGTLTTGTQNLAIGQNVLKLNIVGIGNSGIGFNALANNDSNYNTATGYVALRQNLKGYFNTADGAQALLNNITGSKNTATGGNSLTTLTISSNNTADGYNSLPALTTGASNTASGANSLPSASIASWNSVLGDSVFFNNVSGHGNVGMGYQVGSNTGGDYNIFIGYQAGNHPSQMATPINSIAIGAHSKVTASNQIVIGDSAHTDLRLYGISAGEGNSTLKYDSVTKKMYWGSPSNVSANNAITDSSGRFVLGGDLYKLTTINANYTLTIAGTNSGVQPLSVSAIGTAAIIATTTGAAAIFGETDNGSGITGVADGTGYGVQGTSFNGFAIYGASNNSIPLKGDAIPASTNTVINMLQLFRSTTGVGANGIGGAIQFQTATNLGNQNTSNRSISKWTDATNATRTSQFDIEGVSNAVTQTFANFQTAGIVRVNNLADTLSTKAYVRLFNASLGATIYSADGTIAGDRTVDLNGKNLTFSDGGGFIIHIKPDINDEFRVINAAGSQIRASEDFDDV